jgi:hypothetical protein
MRRRGETSKGWPDRTAFSALVVVLSLLGGLAALSVAAPSASARAASSDSGSCVSAGTTGLTATMTAHSGQLIRNQVINATGCDIGIYVGPGTDSVTIAHVTVFGANEHGIFGQDTKDLTVRDSMVYGNGFATNPKVAENKAIEVVGSWHPAILRNTVINNGYGGIGIADDGPLDPGAPNPGYAHAAVGATIAGNWVANNLNDCGIVIAGYNAGVGARNNRVMDNTVIGNSPENPGGAIGQIVVAADAPETSVLYTWVTDNHIEGSLLPGIVLHSNAPGDVIANTHLQDNRISDNGAYPSTFGTPNTPDLPGNFTGISIVAEAYGMPQSPIIKQTYVGYDTVSNDWYGVWLCQTVSTVIVNLATSSVLTPVTTCAAGGS